MNRLYPLHPDDWEYMYVYSVNSDSIERISDIVDIIRSQYSHYFLWGGRVIAHYIAHVLLMMVKEWSNVINTVVYLAYIYVIYKYTNKRRTVNSYCFISFFLLGVISFVAMIGSPTVPDRSLFITNTLFIMGMGILIANFDFKAKNIDSLQVFFV